MRGEKDDLGVLRELSGKKNPRLLKQRGFASGEGGIRTLGDLAATTLFESAAFNHSATSPARIITEKAEGGRQKAAIQRAFLKSGWGAKEQIEGMIGMGIVVALGLGGIRVVISQQ